MQNNLLQFIPQQGEQIVLVLFLSFLIGLEREEQKVSSDQFRFGGVRTFPLLGLLGYALCQVSSGNLVLPGIGLAVVGAFLWLAYQHKLERAAVAGMTTELSGLLTYVIGTLVWREDYWVATTLTVLAVALLELKTALESLAKRVPGDEILTFSKFLLLTAVILPVVPNRTFGDFGWNPFQTWLIVVAVSAISYGSYLLQLWIKRGGVLVAALLGGAYSSTMVTVVLAKRAHDEPQPHVYSGAMIVSSGVMYLRLLALLAIFNGELVHRLAFPFLVLAAIALAGGLLWMHVHDGTSTRAGQVLESKNPLELGAAFLFAILFAAMLFLTHIALRYWGRAGLFGLAGLTGVTDITPFILGLAESSKQTPVALAAGAIVIAAASNNFVKGIYAYAFADRRTGSEAIALHTVLTVIGLVPLFL